jgi:hypothetical protein
VNGLLLTDLQSEPGMDDTICILFPNSPNGVVDRIKLLGGLL